jgi:hypothetical protein
MHILCTHVKRDFYRSERRRQRKSNSLQADYARTAKNLVRAKNEVKLS